ncbi:hypothetical protein [Vibrio europaeus]|uniref:hypothetical protein n=1 Tax=Vibrio europaeus TaxID=300876 RepID=UPI00233EF5EC|nr:hypothetical protein [Vibrio europaeus]MDC5753558.1 hypothetical protein [Vibrio europaeus]MDC5816530.1 hypothetical protein [Vibrio europaeus]
MNKVEAMAFLESGGMLTHPYFTSSEWVKGLGNGLYEFEDGCRCDADEFWRIRSDAGFNEGWKVKPERGITVNVGAIGHVVFRKAALQAAISCAIPKRNKSDRKRDRLNRWQ